MFHTIEMEEINSSMDMSKGTLCRTCAKSCVRWYAINSKFLNFSVTIRDIIVLLVPQMETELEDCDKICDRCKKILTPCVRFIDKCLCVEADRQEKGLCKKKSSDITPITNLKDDVIKNEVGDLSDVDQKDINTSSLNGDFEKVEQIEQEIDIKSENNDDINDNTLQNNLVKELPSSILCNNILISTKQMCTDKLNEFIGILASNDVETIQFSQDSERTTEQKRVILIGSTLKCNKCYKYFDSRRKHTRHLRVHRRTERIREERNRLKKMRMQKLKENGRRQINGAERKKTKNKHVDLECKTCSEKFSSMEELEFHFKIHPPFVCEKCGKGFVKRAQIKSHEAVHNDKISYVCEVCGRAFKTTSRLRQHALIHENTLHSCKKCPKVFNTIIRLKAHLRNSHGEGLTGIWPCKECGKIFKRSSLHQLHYMQIHVRDGNKKCDICGQGFYRTDYLTRHRRRHVIYGETQESYSKDVAESQTNDTENVERSKSKCRLSDATIKKYRRLGRNLLPPAPYECQICMKIYKHVENLKRHILTHGAARFNCKFCSRTFKIKYLLTRHEKFHEKSDVSEKYRCEICWKRYQTREDLDLHYVTHNNLKYKCELCEESYARQHLLNDHMVNVHPEDGDAEEETEALMMTGLGMTLYNLLK